MLYQVSRNGQMYGPYTLEDLGRYVASGNVLPTDLAKSEAMPDWLPVSQVLGSGAASGQTGFPPSYAAPAAYGEAAISYPAPPNLHWALCLLFGLLTCGLFTLVYDLIQTVWLKKVNPASKSMFLYLGLIILEFVNAGSSFGRLAALKHGVDASPVPASMSLAVLSFLVSLGVLILFLAYRFTMRRELEEHFNGPDPVGLRLSGVMTFFFGGLYFQYHFNRINEIKRALGYRAGY